VSTLVAIAIVWPPACVGLALFVGRFMRTADRKQVVETVPDYVPTEWVTQ
jgi:hypothetical protein